MGTWGHDPFDNDSALDFIVSYENGGAVAVEEALVAVAASRDYIEASDAETAIAAAAFVAAAAGETDWLSNQSARNAYNNSSDFLLLTQMKVEAAAVLERIVAPNSELHQLWQEAGLAELEQFVTTVRRLQADLK